MRKKRLLSYVRYFSNGKWTKLFLLFLFFQVSAVAVLAQNQKIEGTVTDSTGAPLERVSVIVQGARGGAVTDAAGHYSLQAKPGATLIFSYTGYADQMQIVGNSPLVNITLRRANDALEGVVVVGYGTQKKVNLTASVSQVKGEQLANRPVANVTSALQGVTPGLTVLRGSGKPGSEGYDIRIRGFSSVNNTSALVLVDGIEQDLNLLDPSDVESISVLKDASAAAIYGARAAAGVVLVTTKQAKAGRTTVNFNANYGINITARQPQRLNSWDEQTLIDEARFNATGAREFNAEQYEWLENPNFSYRPNPSSDRWEYYGNNNWIKEGMDKINHQSNYSLSVGGGQKNLNYLISGSFYKRDGVLRYGPDDNKRYNLKVNINAELNKYLTMKVTAGYIGSFVDENSFGTEQIINRLYRSRARQSLYTPAEDVTGQPYNGDLQINAVDIEKNAGLETRNYETITGKLDLQVKNLVKGLTFNLIAWRNQNNYAMENKSRTLIWYGRSTNTIRFSINQPNSYSQTKNRAYQNNVQGYLNYALNLGAHHFTFMQGGSFEEYRKDEFSASAQSMVNNDFFSFNFADPLTKTNSNKIETWALASAFGRLNYNYDNRYLFEANYRYDGSSRLAPQIRWQVFPSFSAAWRIDQEKFMQNVGFVDNLKLRGSWGQLGNSAALGLYDYIPLLTSGNSLTFNGVRSTYVYQGQLASPTLTWETLQQWNVGIDAGFLKNRLTVTVEYFVKRNKDMLSRPDVPNIIGIPVPYFNKGELKSWGKELEIRWADVINKKLSYNIGFNISDNQNKLLHYGDRNQIGDGGVIPLLEGYPLNTVWGYTTAGYFQTQQEADDYKANVQYPFFPNPAPGDVKYLDRDGNHVISSGGHTPADPGDLVYLGTTNARYQYGFDMGADWKGFNFSIFFQGALDRSFLIDQGTLSPILGTADMPWTIHMDHWTPDNPDALFPRMYQTSAHNFKPSDKWTQNGSYIRLKNVQIGYTVPIRKHYIHQLRIYVSGQDLWESTKVLSVFDPEVGNNVSATTYPFYRTISFGLNLSL